MRFPTRKGLECHAPQLPQAHWARPTLRHSKAGCLSAERRIGLRAEPALGKRDLPLVHLYTTRGNAVCVPYVLAYQKCGKDS